MWISCITAPFSLNAKAENITAATFYGLMGVSCQPRFYSGNTEGLGAILKGVGAGRCGSRAPFVDQVPHRVLALPCDLDLWCVRWDPFEGFKQENSAVDLCFRIALPSTVAYSSI